MKLTVAQFRTLEFIAGCPKGQTFLLPLYWRDRHHQALIRRGLLRIGADPFKTKAHMLRGRITGRGRKAVAAATLALRAAAAAAERRDFEKYVRELEEGGAP